MKLANPPWQGKPKVGAITVDSTTAQHISQLQGAVKGLTNLDERSPIEY